MDLKEKEAKFLLKALKKMFSVVGAKYTKEFCKKDGWYLKYSWNNDEERKYSDWFIKECSKTFKCSKKTALHEWSWFNLTHGWTHDVS
jgi:hypothetical protein